MNLRMKRPSPAFVVAMVALFVALGGTAGAVVTAAVPLAKRALVADNAKKVGGLDGSDSSAGQQLRWRSRSHPPDHALRARRPAWSRSSRRRSRSRQIGQGAFTADVRRRSARRSSGGFTNPVGAAFCVRHRSDVRWNRLVDLPRRGDRISVGGLGHVVQAICLK